METGEHFWSGYDPKPDFKAISYAALSTMRGWGDRRVLRLASALGTDDGMCRGVDGSAPAAMDPRRLFNSLILQSRHVMGSA